MHSDREASTDGVPRQLPEQSRWNVTNPGLRPSHSVWTVRDVVTSLRISKSEVYRVVKRGVLPCFCVSGHVRFLASEIVKWSSESSGEKKSAQTAGIESDGYLSAIVANAFEQLSPKERL